MIDEKAPMRRARSDWLFGACMVISAFMVACREETPSTRKTERVTSITDVAPLFLLPGYEDKINTDHGYLIHGIVADFVQYDLGARFPPTQFLDAVDVHLRRLGWSCPEFTFGNPPARASEAAKWWQPPRADRPMLVFTRWWVQSDEVVSVSGVRAMSSDTNGQSPVRVTILRFHADQAKIKIEEYRRLNGVHPAAQTDTE